MEKEIVLILTADEWDKVRNSRFYCPDILKTDGFIPCAAREQVYNAKEFLYKERSHHKILYIDPKKVKAPIVYEDLLKTGETFPHIYGALNLDAVAKVEDFKPNEG